MRKNPLIGLFIDLFESALHTSDDKLAHLHLPTGDKVYRLPEDDTKLSKHVAV